MGLGLFDNKINEYVQDLTSGHWYTDDDGMLYIVPSDENGIAGIEGPDDTVVMAELNAIYRDLPFKLTCPFHVAKRLGLTVIADTFKRFNTEDGNYTA
ncbi:MAG: hypothetical protein Q7S87_10035 [Agitococcus sp.]|nr:hypothetical protein [Agitococcus sp.]MDO9179329.1 hypothetical protein [Agitococcus sp.]